MTSTAPFPTRRITSDVFARMVGSSCHGQRGNTLDEDFEVSQNVVVRLGQARRIRICSARARERARSFRRVVVLQPSTICGTMVIGVSRFEIPPTAPATAATVFEN